MREARKLHTCSLVETQIGVKKIVVVGGTGGGWDLDSVEIFNISANEWFKGERIVHLCIVMLKLSFHYIQLFTSGNNFSMEIAYHSAVSYEKSFIISGGSSFGTHQDTIYRSAFFILSNHLLLLRTHF